MRAEHSSELSAELGTAQSPQPIGGAVPQLPPAQPGLMDGSAWELLIFSATSTAWLQHSHPKKDTEMGTTPSLCPAVPWEHRGDRHTG